MCSNSRCNISTITNCTISASIITSYSIITNTINIIGVNNITINYSIIVGVNIIIISSAMIGVKIKIMDLGFLVKIVDP